MWYCVRRVKQKKLFLSTELISKVNIGHCKKVKKADVSIARPSSVTRVRKLCCCFVSSFFVALSDFIINLNLYKDEETR